MGGDFSADTSSLPHPHPLNLWSLDSIFQAEQLPHSRHTPGEAWPNIGGQAPDPVVAPLFTDGDNSVFVPASTADNIPTGGDFLSDTLPCHNPRDTIFGLWILFPQLSNHRKFVTSQRRPGPILGAMPKSQLLPPCSQMVIILILCLLPGMVLLPRLAISSQTPQPGHNPRPTIFGHWILLP